ncbi:ABC transporter ATP-binding protein [Candidatus Kaiserbacteria bacterium]|nr:MAG: ABC transporter ATP-binding protein [Candidatus Kaiserbacteria bacterium]
MIKGTNVKRVYTKGAVETHALRGVDIEIKKGEFVAIVGKSGAGKSTLLYQLSLLDTPTAGEIYIDNTNIAELTAKERTNFRLNYLGYVFQDYALLPELTAEENVLLPLMMQGYTIEDAQKRAVEVLTRLEMSHRTSWRPSQLSGGEQQRVSVARAIAHTPLILFADEPTANLDSVTSKQLLEYLEELNQAGQTIVMVTHELEYAQHAHRVIEMSDGKIIKETNGTK